MVGDELLPAPCAPGVPPGLKELEEGSFLTKAPMTPSDVSLRYSKGRDLEVVFKKGYRNNGICAADQLVVARVKQIDCVPFRNRPLVSL